MINTDVSIVAGTRETVELFGAKFLRVTVGAADVTINLVTDPARPALDEGDYITLKAAGVYRIRAPRNKAIFYLFVKAAAAATLNVIAGNVEIEKEA